MKYLAKTIKDTSSIVAIYLFGSFGSLQEKEHSDIDLAFLVNDAMYNADPFEAAGRVYLLATQIGMQFERETDVVILNFASLEIAYEIVTSGQCVYESDQDKRLEYEAVIRGMYYDFQPFLTELRSKCLAQL